MFLEKNLEKSLDHIFFFAFQYLKNEQKLLNGRNKLLIKKSFVSLRQTSFENFTLCEQENK